jgi:hypothetical protein
VGAISFSRGLWGGDTLLLSLLRETQTLLTYGGAVQLGAAGQERISHADRVSGGRSAHAADSRRPPISFSGIVRATRNALMFARCPSCTGHLLTPHSYDYTIISFRLAVRVNVRLLS